MLEVSEGIELKYKVLGCIPVSETITITGKELAATLHQKDTRKIRLSILELLEEGHPICSSPNPPFGYSYAVNPEQVNQSLAILRSYGKNLFRHYRNLKRARDKAFGDDRARAGQLTLL